MEKIYQVKVFGFEGGMKVIDLCGTEEEFKSLTVKHLKEKIEQHFSVNTENLALIFRGQRLEGDSVLLCQYGITHLSVLQLAVKLCGGGDVELPSEDDSGMGDKTGKNRSMEKLSWF